MARKWLALLLVALGAFGLLPYLQNAVALSKGTVMGHSTDRSKYDVQAISSASQVLVACEAKPIAIQRNTSMSGDMFKCWTNYAASVNLTWSLADPNDPLLSSVTTPSAVTLASTDTSLCRTARITARDFPNSANDTTGTVVFKGTTPSTSNFYVEIYFPVTVTVQKNAKGVGFTCP